MSKKYYLRNLCIGVMFFVFHLMIYWSDIKDGSGLIYLPIILVSSVFFPFSKIAVEKMALHYTSKNFWHTGLFADTAGKTGGYAIYYLFCFVFSIPISICYFICMSVKERNS